MRRHFAVLAALTVLLTACDAETSVPTSAPSATATSASSSLPELRPKVDAIAVLLAACVPKLAGEPVDPIDNCANLMPDVAEVISEVEQQADPLAEAARTAIGEVRRQLAEIAPCEPWFAGGGRTDDGQLDFRCNQAWDSLSASYDALRDAL
ncbi:hypothetical protein SAMN05216266_101388 [Amycolatopsis marina]|uniref:Uncharacterized protein n=1 Tax=Amycolatopsis marina TaxID=490629 RepID=A0A1I0VPJ4_9PSEU|nr:hypothetical protein [Amycolatopsis marina]SFA78138.1 hypothetical protein SAMN05216266_101388 [Amycolatopsis marina]